MTLRKAQNFWLGNRALTIKEKNLTNFTLSRLNTAVLKDTVQKINTQATLWEKIFGKDVPHK